MSTTANQGLRRLFDHLEDVHQTGPNNWVAKCPFHTDVHPSFRIDIKCDDFGRPHPYFYCPACGAGYHELLAKTGIAGHTLHEGLQFSSASASASASVRRASRVMSSGPTAMEEYHYRFVQRDHEALLADDERLDWLRTERGLVRGTVIEHRLGYRSGIKLPVYEEDMLVNIRTYTMPPRHEYAAKWKGETGVERSLYPDPIGLLAEPVVVLTEGEFDALLARQSGLPAWTQTGGALARLLPRWEPYLAGKKVVVCFDCDEPGRRGARQTARQLIDWGCQVRVVDLGLGEHEDITDWFVRHGRTANEFFALIKRTPDFGSEWS